MSTGALVAEPETQKQHDVEIRHRLNRYLAQRVPSIIIANSFTMCLTCEVLKVMFSWRTRYPLSYVPIKPVPRDMRRTRTNARIPSSD